MKKAKPAEKNPARNGPARRSALIIGRANAVNDNSEMMTSAVKAFEVDNAKQLSVEKTVKYFVPPKNFENLFTAKNHILLGARGSGKTTWVRMLAHDHVLLASRQHGLPHQYARNALQNHVIGIYIPTNIGLIGSLKNKPWQNEENAEKFFQWRLNLHSCAALIPIIRSCIDYYINDPAKRGLAELNVCRDLAKQWLRQGATSSVKTLESLRLLLATVETEKANNISMYRSKGLPVEQLNDYFDSELFQPVKYSIQVLTYYIGIPSDATWMLCIDEAEYLTESHHRILNTHLRAASGNLVFKIATMPFAHHTLATNAEDPVRDGHDFDYVYVDRDPLETRPREDNEFLNFAREVFQRRVHTLNLGRDQITLLELLGPSPLLDEKTVQGPGDISAFMILLEKYANPATVTRAKRLLETDERKFRNEISRKMHGALVLREALNSQVGNSKSKVYAGEAMLVRCADGNPRRLMRLLNALLRKVTQMNGNEGSIHFPLAAVVQNEVIETIARDTLNRVQSEPPFGVRTYEYLLAIGNYMRNNFRSRRIGSDIISSIIVSADDGEHIQKFLKQAVQLSLLTPSADNGHNGPNAPLEGTFHFAFLFAPLFGLLPRRNRAQRLPKILSASPFTFEESQPVQAVLEL